MATAHQQGGMADEDKVCFFGREVHASVGAVLQELLNAANDKTEADKAGGGEAAAAE